MPITEYVIVVVGDIAITFVVSLVDHKYVDEPLALIVAVVFGQIPFVGNPLIVTVGVKFDAVLVTQPELAVPLNVPFNKLFKFGETLSFTTTLPV